MRTLLKNIVPYILITFSIWSCNHKKSISYMLDDVSNEYAKLFKIQIDSSGNKSILIYDIWDENKGSKFIPNDILKKDLERVVCMSTTHISFFEILGALDVIVGVSGAKYISNKEIQNKISSGEITDIGFESTLNYEALIKLAPQLVITYGIRGENNSYIRKIEELGIPVISIGDYLEEHPLGKTEYLKLFGVLLNKEQEADSLFNNIKDRYLTIKNQSKNYQYKPMVLLNAPWKDVWYIPGEFNYMSTLIKDAGAEVLLEKKGISHSFGYNIEEIIKEAHLADFWLNPNDHVTLKSLLSINNTISNLKLFKNNRIYNNNKLRTESGGSDFWEKGVVEPDVILTDLFTIFHNNTPENISKLKYYIQLD